MTDDIISDLKDFIAATVSQQSVTLRDQISGDMRSEIDNLDDKLSTRIDDLSAAVTEALDNKSEARVSVLEAKV